MILKQTGKRRVFVWIGSIFLALVIIVAGAALYFSARWKPLLTKKIKEAVYNSSHQLYRIDFKDIHLNLLTGSAAVDGIVLQPDTAVFNLLKKNKSAPTHLFQLKLERLRLSGIGILTAYFKKKLDMNSIILDQPSINMIYNKVPQRSEVKEERTLYQQISKTLKSIHVRNIKITDADFDYISGATGRTLNAVKHLNVNVDDVLLDSLSQYDTTRFYYTKDISFELIGYKSLSKDKMYTVKIDTITGSATGKTVLMKGFSVIPMYPDLTFSRKYKTQKDRYDLHFARIAFNGVDFMKLNQEGSLYARSVVIGPAKVAVFMNRELPPPGFDKGRNYPHIALKRLPIQLLIDTVKIRKTDVAYTEYNPIARKKGTVDLQNLRGTILNVTNDSLQLTKKNHAWADLNTRIIKAADLNVQIDFNLTDKDGAFSYKGHAGPMDMRALNPLARSLGLVDIERGKMQKADFKVRANLRGSSGTMYFYYTDLKVNLLKEDGNGDPHKKKGLLSFLANTILIKDANPAKGEPVRSVNISFQRTPAASFFNLLWKGVFMGIRETAGIGAVSVKSPEKAYGKVKDKQQERKDKREDRKEKRKKQK